MKNKKYELLKDDTKEINGATLYRIKALKSFFLRGRGTVNAGDLGGYVQSESNLSHEENCWIFDKACVYGDALVFGDAKIYGKAEVFDDAKIYGKAEVFGDALVFDDAKIYGKAEVYGDAKIYGDALVFGDAIVYGDAKICGGAEIKETGDYITISGLGRRNRTTTFYKSKSGAILVKCGCFSGTLKEFKNKVIETHKATKYTKEYLAAVQVAKIHFEVEE